MQKFNRRRSDKRINLARTLLDRFATVPAGILVVALLLFWQRELLPSPTIAMLNMASYILAFVGMALSAGFKRSRIFFVLLLTTLAQFALSSPAPAAVPAAVYGSEVYYFACLLLPINILIFAVLQERGVLTTLGRRRILFLFLQLFFVIVVLMSQDQELLRFMSQDAAALLPRTPIPKIPFAVACLAMVVLALRHAFGKTVADNTFLNVLLTLLAGLHFKDDQVAVPLFFAAAALIMIVAAMRDSYSLAYLDELTGLPSRRALQEELSRLDDRYTVAMLDIDHFKKFNDKYGHDAGDDVLRLVAAIIRDVGGGGRAFRYGGEEFTILFQGAGLEEARPYLEDLREQIAKRGFSLRGKGASGKRLFVTASIGAAEKLPKLKTADEVVKAADIALYRAKEQGRNCVSC